MNHPIPEWTTRFGPNDQIITTTEGPADDAYPTHVHIEVGGITVVTVSALNADYAEHLAVEALQEHTQDRRAGLHASRRATRVPA